MLYLSIFDAKENVSLEDINRERDEWYRKGQDKIFLNLCESIQRYEIVGRSPLRIVFLIKTGDPQALNMLSRHFGNKWVSNTFPAVHREIYEALEEDRSIIGG